MKELTEFAEEILNNVFCNLECALYFKWFKDKYLLVSSNSTKFPSFVIDSKWSGYTPIDINSSFLLLFPEGTVLSDEINAKVQFARKCLEHYFHRQYLQKVGNRLPEIEIPYISFVSLSSVLRSFLPNSSVFLWLKQKSLNFYRVIYSHPKIAQRYVSFSKKDPQEIVRVNTIIDYELRNFLDNNNVNYVKLTLVSDDIFLWGFQNFPVIPDNADKFIEIFYPDNFSFLDSFELFMDKMFFKRYNNFRSFAKDLQNIFLDIEDSFPIYFKIQTKFIEDEFYLDEKGVFRLKKEGIENLRHIEHNDGGIFYYLPLKKVPKHLINLIDFKLKEILTSVFYENFEREVKSLYDFARSDSFDTLTIENFMKKISEGKLPPEFKTSIMNLINVLNRSIHLNEEYEGKLKGFIKMFKIRDSVWNILLREGELYQALILFFKFIREAYNDVTEIVWCKVEKDSIKDFVSTTRFIKREQFTKVLKDSNDFLKWENHFIIKNCFAFESAEYNLSFFFEEEPRLEEYIELVKAFNLFLYFFVNFKRYHLQLKEIGEFQRDFPVKIRAIKNIFSLPERSEYIFSCEKTSLNLNEIVSKALNEHITNIKKKNIQIEFQEKGKMLVRGYEPLLNYAFSTLLKELIEYNRIKGKMLIIIDKKIGNIYIEDTGIGLSKVQTDMLLCKRKEKDEPLSVIGEIFKIHNFELNIDVEKGIGNKIRIFL